MNFKGEDNHSSLQKLIQKRQSSSFVGREDIINFFIRNLSIRPEDQSRKFLFHIWGQGGIGKTFLLKKFEAIFTESGSVSCYVDEDYREIPKILNGLVKQLEKLNGDFEEFKRLYKTYQQRKEEIESDPELPTGLSALIGKTLAKGSLGLVNQVPVVGAATSLLDKEIFADKVGDWTTYLTKKITSKDEVRLLLEPAEILTPAFTSGLMNLGKITPNIGILFDTFEVLGNHIETWLLSLINGSFGELPSNLIIITAGQGALSKNRWIQYESILTSFELKPFTKEECLEYLRKKNISDERVIELVMNLSSNLPLLVATLAVGENESLELIGDPSDTAVERFLKWVDEPKKKNLALDASLLRRLSKDLIANLAESEDLEEIFSWMKTMPFIQRRSDGWAYHNLVREQMIRYKKRESAREFSTIHKIIATFYKATLPSEEDLKARKLSEEEISQCSEYTYHFLSENPHQNFLKSIQLFVNILKQSDEPALRISETMLQVANEQEIKKISRLANIFCKALNTSSNGSYDYLNRVEMINELFKLGYQDAWLYSHRAHAYHLSEDLENALIDYQKAIELGYENHWIFERLGQALSSLGEFNEAIKALNLAEEIYSDCPSCFLVRADTYALMEKYEDAISDVNSAIQIAPSYHRAYRKKGEILFAQENYSEAVKSLEIAVEMAPECAGCLFKKAVLNQEAGNSSRALSDYEKLLSIGSKDSIGLNESFIHVERGKIYQDLGDFDRAFDAFNLSIKADKITSGNQHDKKMESKDLSDARTPEILFSRRKNSISEKRALKQSVKYLKEFGVFLGIEESKYLITITENPRVRREFITSQNINTRNFLKAKPFLYKSFLYQKMGKFDAALDNMNKVILISGHDGFYASRARIFLQSGNYRQAIQDIEKCLLLMLEKAGFSDQSILDENKGLSTVKIDGYMPCQILYELVVAKVKAYGFTNSKRDAVMVLRGLVEAKDSSDRPFILYYIGGLYALSDDAITALKYLKVAVEHEPFIYSLAGYDVAWVSVRKLPAFTHLRPSFEFGRKGFGL